MTPEDVISAEKLLKSLKLVMEALRKLTTRFDCYQIRLYSTSSGVMSTIDFSVEPEVLLVQEAARLIDELDLLGIDTEELREDFDRYDLRGSVL